MAGLGSMSTPAYKRCYKCSQTRPLDMFVKDKYSKDGLWSMCRICNIKRRSDQYQANKVKELAQQRTRLDYGNLREYRRQRSTRVRALVGPDSQLMYPGYRFLQALKGAEVVDVT